MTIRAFSFGGGVQSTAALVLAARGEIAFPVFIFADVGDDSEHPDTLVYVRDHAAPYAERHGIKLVTVAKTTSLLTVLMDAGKSSIPIPAMYAGRLPGRRNCTSTWKIQPVARELRRRGATRGQPAALGLGISVDEWHRAKDSREAHVRHEFPLLDLKLDRTACKQVIAEAGLPEPPKSACWFCPLRSMGQWRDMRRERPDLFDQAVALEDRLNEKRTARGKDAVYLANKAVPLEQAVGLQLVMDVEDAGCESGFCMT